MADRVTAFSRRGAAALALLAVAGLALSGWLAWLHARIHGNPEYLPVCTVSETIDCAAVAASPQAVFLGVPVAVFGLAGFGLALFFALRGLGPGRGAGDGAGLVALLGLSCLAVSAILAVVSVVAVGALCPDCVVIYAISLAMAVVAHVRVGRRGGWRVALAGDLAALRRRPVRGSAPWFAGLAALVAARALLPVYWELPGRADPRILEGVDDESRPWLGAGEPELVIHEFTDYECPYCRTAHRRLRRALLDNPGRLRIVRHDYARMPCAPNDERKRLSRCEMARAAICAGDQGRFWDWNDAVWARPRPAAGEARKTYVFDMARFLDLDLDQLDGCLFAPATIERAHRVYREARRARIADTPTYLIGGERHTQAEMLALIDAAM